MEKGIVKGISRLNDLFAIQIDNGSFSLIEIIGGHTTNLGDIIKGNLNELGDNIVYNETEDEELDIIVQSLGLDHRQAKQKLGL